MEKCSSFPTSNRVNRVVVKTRTSPSLGGLINRLLWMESLSVSLLLWKSIEAPEHLNNPVSLRPSPAKLATVRLLLCSFSATTSCRQKIASPSPKHRCISRDSSSYILYNPV
ncbi:UNVERIFIED_CONTAM: hypothetical protein Sangu_3186300 [Sesamum angustifolium]|uniref:Uncharacterized protein n=1 Tax=Sesamum angustifolium TaxID=2727405 RepID=A0AAW2JN27_9LAMI